MVLRVGITGFRTADDRSLPITDLTQTTNHCIRVAQSLNGRVIQMPRPAEPGNFAEAILELPNALVGVLVNLMYPIVAFTVPGDTRREPIAFTNCELLADALGRFGRYMIMGRDELEAPVPFDELGRLSQSERDQVAYWRPNRLGDIVFNRWD